MRECVFITAFLTLAAVSSNAIDSAGCDESRVATAHFAGGVVVDPQPEGGPMPCASAFGDTAQAAPVAILPDGTVFGVPLSDPQVTHTGPGFDPLSRLVRSSDRGATWEAIDSPVEGIFSWMSSDPTTGRLWYTNSFTQAQQINWSDDGGETWTINPSCCPKGEGAPKILEGPAPVGGAQPTGSYPHVVYFCANTAEEAGEAGYSNLSCYKSLDGGSTFLPVGGFPDDPLPEPDAECRNRTRPGVVGPNGVLYFPVRACDTGLALAISQDEGATWQRVPLPTTTVEDGLFTANLGVDDQGNLYFAFRGAGTLPHLLISRDGGDTWSAPIQVGAPGVVDASLQQLAITVGEPGHVAIAYMGSSDGGATFSGYITESLDALDDNPLFWSAAVNDPSEPLQLGTPPADPTDAARGFTNRILYRTAAIGPDATPWAGFHCHRTDSCPLGPNDRIGVVGHLEWPDVDADGLIGAADNCPFVANADQLDSGGVNTTEPDGIGDACQCGDVSGGGIVNGQDANAIKRHGLGLEPNETFVVPGNCDVSGNGSCNGQDANAVKRAALGGAPNPLFGQNCHNAIGAPVPPGL